MIKIQQTFSKNNNNKNCSNDFYLVEFNSTLKIKPFFLKKSDLEKDITSCSKNSSKLVL